MLQVNVAREESKFGMEVEDFPSICQLARQLEHVRVCGLMCMAPNFENVEDTRPIFRIAHALYEDMKPAFPDGQVRYLSMGMTHDLNSNRRRCEYGTCWYSYIRAPQLLRRI